MRSASEALSSPRFAWLYLLYAPLLAYLLSVGSLTTWDSFSFINYGSQRPPVYPLFLLLQEAVLGSGYLKYVHLPQILIGVAAIVFFCRTVRATFALSHLVTFSVSAVLAICYLRYPPVGNYVLSEGPALPLFVLFTAFVIRAVADHRFADYSAVFILANLLVLTRHQFLFVYPFCLLLLLYQLWTIRRLKLWLGLLFVLAGVSVATHVLERGYHYVLTGTASAFPLSGLQLGGIAFYVAKPENAAVLEPKEAELLNLVLADIRKLNMSGQQYPELTPRYVDPSIHLEASYSTIVLYALFPRATELVLGRQIPGTAWQELPAVMSHEEAQQLNSFLMGMWRKLVVANIKDFAIIYMRNVIFHAGGWIILCVLAVSFAVSMLNALVTGRALPAALAFALMLHFGNMLFVALVEPLYQRYVVYGESMAFAMLLLAVCLTATAPALASGRPLRVSRGHAQTDEEAEHVAEHRHHAQQ